MNSNKITIIALNLGLALVSCDRDHHAFDASGTFEADETLISAEASGVLRALSVEEGQILSSSEVLGYVDTIPLYLSKKQLLTQMEVVESKKPDMSAQLAALNEQLEAQLVEQQRISQLLQSDAATPKQMDDVNAQIEITRGNIRALQSSLRNNTASLDKELLPIAVQIEIVEDQMARSVITNPIKGTVLTVYAEPHEQVAPGQPLYKIADLSQMTLRIYISGNQLPQIKLGQVVKIWTDDGEGGYAEASGEVYWISEKAEFTPKTIQTKDERANKVYAVKVRVSNDGRFKIGMYGEIEF